MEIYWTQTKEPQSQTAHGLLERVLEERYGITSPELLLGEQGKPYLPEGPEFSISHSHGIAAVAVGAQPLGLDVEELRPYHARVPERIMSPSEYRWFLGRGELKRDFFTLWTLKESYYKYLGTGLRGFPNDTEFYFDGSWHLRGKELWFYTRLEKNLLMTVCCHEQEEIRIHRI